MPARAAKAEAKSEAKSAASGKRKPKAEAQDIDASADVGLDGLALHVGYAVRRFQLWIFQDFIKTLAAVDITPTQYSVLTVISANPGLTQMAVAKRLGIERARLVHLLNALEQRNLVKRAASKVDRRSHALHLTASGEASLRQFKLLAAEHERHVIEKIGKDNRERLLEILASFR
ncbi:MarR family winged helix-turn-helix transcriptional regulator [Bradyrhizobium sp. CCBAU 51753]|uniref:MarR family winged helix-turn-helix transcriptional regulator n=1 Tax=Bradyrhizobium sp. CCBAU 51753 TaxID=1325100 RepID=UPI00188BBBB8|nr:MarR family transcriptional regulator [Bradyrhizobium sp. CCBAU 51753]